MASLDELVGQPISTDTTFNWTWFVEVATCGCLALFFLFYFNRLFATVVSYIIRFFTWHKYRIWVDIQALQVSFLAGRVFFKGVRYHAENETVCIQSGYMTWRYWHRNTRQVDLTAEYLGKDNGFSDDGAKEKEKTARLSDDSEPSESPTPDPEPGRVKLPDNLDARISINITGLEWFVYNRTPVYNAIVDAQNAHGAAATTATEDEGSQINGHGGDAAPGHLFRRKNKRTSSTASTAADSTAAKVSSEAADRTADHPRMLGSRPRTDTMMSAMSEVASIIEPSSFWAWFLRALPIGIECTKGAITLGNHSTRALVVTTFTAAHGHVDATASGPSDVFRQLFDFEIEHPKVEMRPNPDYRRSQLAAAERLIGAVESMKRVRRWYQVDLGIGRRLKKLVHSIARLVPGLRGSRGSLRTAAFSHDGDNKSQYMFDDFNDETRSWHGLSRYLDEDERDDHEGWNHVDYARFSQILDSPAVHFKFYWDTPGPVTEDHILHRGLNRDHVNTVEPPAYGLDLTVKGGMVNYGPWADRLRLEIQSAFFPNAYHSATPASALGVGDTRVSTIMTIRVDIEDEVTLRVPTRERSKDWQWRGRAHATKEAAAIRKQREKRHFRFRRSQKVKLGPDVRPFGWLSVSTGRDSTVRYDMDMYPRENGYRNQLRLDLKNTKATSSVNHALLWRCTSQKVVCDLSNPLVWNSAHRWSFNVESNAMEMFLLRDHMFLLTDLISDFTAGAKADYMTFVPFMYQLRLTFPDLKLYLNANDYNIIDNPCDGDENAYLILGFQQLNGNVDIPMEYFSPRQSKVTFVADGHNGSLELTTPVWNTLNTLMEDKTMATLKRLDLAGSYNYFAETSPKLTDSLFMDLAGEGAKFYLHGFLIRYFMNVRENYFGEDLHFRTLEEYQDILAGHDRNIPRPSTKKDNDLDVILTVRADKSCVFLPANIYSRRETVRVDVLLIEADLRFTNYYMDLQVSSSPLEASLETILHQAHGESQDTSNTQLFIDGANVYGHRLFGAPPAEPTYVCNWDFDVGEVIGECSTKFVHALINAIMAFIFTLDDDENALPQFRPSDLHDVTFLRATVGGVRIWLLADQAAFLVELSKSNVSFSDWAGPEFAKSVRADAPRVLVAAVDHTSAIRHRKGIVDTYACFETSIKVGSLDKTDNLPATRSLQQQHVRYHDQRTHRTDWLLEPHMHYAENHKKPEWAREPPATPAPAMPEPLGRVASPLTQLENDNRGSTDRLSRRNGSFLASTSLSHRRTTLRGNSEEQPEPRGAVLLQENGTAHSSTASLLDTFAYRSRVYDRGTVSAKSHASPTAFVTFSSPWAPPHFSFNDVHPDTKSMPPVSGSARMRSGALGLHRSDDPDTATDEFVGTSHLGIIVFVENGLRGFCTPALFTSIGQFVREMTMDHSTDLLDQVQIAAMKKIMEPYKLETFGHMLDLAIQMPFAHIRLINSLPDKGDLQPSVKDQYNVELSGVQVMFRSIQQQADPRTDGSKRDGQLAYGSIDALTVRASDNAYDVGRAAAQAEISMSNFGFWFSSLDLLKSKMQLSHFSVVLWADQLAKMAGLIQRSTLMGDGIASAFAGLDQSYKSQHLIHHLTQDAANVPDPIFLTRPSYVLRSADRHARLADSWKIIARLRHIYLTLGQRHGYHVYDPCKCQHFELDDTARRQALSSFEKWRGWDHSHDKVPVVYRLFDGDDRTCSGSVSRQPFLVQSEIVIGNFSIILDPGPRQSDLTLLGLDTNIILGSGDYHKPSGQTAQKVIFQTYLADAALNLNWSLVELARQVIELGNPIALTKSESSSSPKSTVKSSAPHVELSVVVGIDLASIYLTSPNLKLKWAAETFRSAVAHNLGGNMPGTTVFNVAANTAMAKFKGHSHTLFLWRLGSPKLYGSILPQTTDSLTRNIVRVCATSDKLRFQMKEDIVSVLGVVEAVLHEEAAAITRLVRDLPNQGGESQRGNSREADEPEAKLELHVALFLDDYKLNFAVVPTLQYSITGRVARTSIVPRRDGGIEINFDVKQHQHSFEVPQSITKGDLSILTIPPINGRISARKTARLISFQARTAIEQINLEATGVRACFDALNQPGVLRLIPDAKQAFEQVQQSIDSLSGKQSPVTERKAVEEPKLLLRYAIHGTFAGLRIHLVAPAVRDDHSHKAELELELKRTSIYIHNQAGDEESIYELPQFILNSHGIGLGMYRTTGHNKINAGRCSIGLKASGKTESDGKNGKVQVYRAWSDGLVVEMYEETATLGVDVVAFLQDRIKSIKLADEGQSIQHIRRMTTVGLADRLKPKEPIELALETTKSNETSSSSALYDSTYALDLDHIQLRYNLVSSSYLSPSREHEDLVFSIRKVDFRTRQEGTARLSILDTQLQIVPQSQFDEPTKRTANSALLPEVVFGTAYLSTKYDRRFAFQAKGKALDLRLAADFIIPASALQKSIAAASAELRNASNYWESGPDSANPQAAPFDILGGKRLASLLVDADFAGAVVHVSPRVEAQQASVFGFLKGKKRSRAGRYGQAVQGENVSAAILQAPGVELKVEYKDNGLDDPSLSTEVKVAASSNTLYPTVVPLIREISSSIKELMEDEQSNNPVPEVTQQSTSYLSGDAINNANPTAILGRCKLNAGLYIQRQEFGLSCQPIARVAATARFADIFVTVNTVSGPDQERFFSILTTFNKLEASVQHVYSRESTASFEVDSIVMSLMNSKHVSATTGISAILNVSPMKTDINAKQLQDFLLFREIWYPAELRGASKPSAPIVSTQESQAYAMQRYQEISAKGTLPWNAIVSVEEVKLQVDLGQGLGKSAFTISKLWASSKKNNDSEQNLCIGFERVGIDSVGRMSGFIELQNLRARTSIRWPLDSEAQTRAPLVQASVAFEHLRVKAAFDYQPFAVADISSFEFLMYNVRQSGSEGNDRLVAILDGGKVQVFCTTGTAAQVIALYQAFERLVEEKQQAYETALHELDRFLRRKSVFPSSTWTAPTPDLARISEKVSSPKGTFSLHTDVVVSLRGLDAGVFPATFFDNQILKIEALDVQARFAVSTTNGKTHSGLGMQLGQVRVALSNVNRVTTTALSEVSVPDVIERATTSRGGTIMKVPRLVSSMQTWQAADSSTVEYIFRSTFEGKVDVGWNYARISFIRGMWQTHSRALAQRLGKPLPPSAVKITAEPQGEGGQGQEKITAVVNVPQSKFSYIALEPPVIDTPQLRDMGEATPPLEWIGLHRDKLPEATHSIVIISLLEVAREVEDAYTRILGVS